MTHENRVTPDRRHRPTPLWNRYFLRGRRMAPRRSAEDPTYVDRPGPIWIALAAVVLALGAVDIWLTHYEMGQGCAAEGNPVMRWLLETSGATLAWLLKAVITLFGAWLLLSHHRWPFAATGLIAVAIYYVGLLGIHLLVMLNC